MVAKNSRYARAKQFVFDADETIVFRGIRPRPISTAEGIMEHVVKQGERLDILSLYYYNNAHMWWRIVDANPDILFGGELALEQHIGSVILIPRLENAKGG